MGEDLLLTFGYLIVGVVEDISLSSILGSVEVNTL